MYHEGGDSYRPFIIIPINNPALWSLPNICYYRSSGRSNENSYPNTWFPTGGLIEADGIRIHGITYDKGHIIKMSNLSNQDTYPDWIYLLMNEFIIQKYNAGGIHDIFTILHKSKVSEVSDKDIVMYNNIIHEVSIVYKFISLYFLYDWQLKISALLGGGYWNINTHFHHFVLNFCNYSLPKDVKISVDFEESSSDPRINTDEIIAFLISHKGQIDIRELPPGPVPLMTIDIRKQTMNAIALRIKMNQFMRRKEIVESLK
jgi:hypothetical protein